MEEIDPIYFDRSYYMSPNEGGSKAYSLLRKALQESQKVGIAKIIIRSKEQMAVIRVYDNTLVMETIHFPDEVRRAGDVPNVPSDDKVTDKELDTAIMLIDQLTSEFEPEKYTDEYRTALLELIESKRSGQETVTPTAKETPSNVTDLMAALQASIDRTKPRSEAAGRKEPALKKETAVKKETAAKKETIVKKPAAPRKKAAPKVKKEA
jgi:DNA end-binding protein Ku